MTPETREQFRLSLLRALGAAAPYPLPAGQLVLGAHLAGFRFVEKEEVLRELSYLDDKNLVARESKAISPETAGWKITAAGRDELARLGLD